MTEQKANDFKDTAISRHHTVDGDHGRIETRTTTVIADVAWLQERHKWPGLRAIIMVESIREIAGKTEREMRLYITSLTLACQPALKRDPLSASKRDGDDNGIDDTFDRFSRLTE